MAKKTHDDDALFDLGDDELEEGETDVNIPDVPDDDAGDPPPTTRAGGAKAPTEPPTAHAALGEKALGMTADIPIQVVAVLGKKSMTLQDLLQLELGQLIDLGQPVSTSVDLVANGKLVAKGDLIDIDGQLGVKIIRMVR